MTTLKTFKLVLIISLSLVLCSCLVSKNDYNQAQTERDSVLAGLNEIRTENSRLSSSIIKAYGERDILAAKLAKTEAAFSTAREAAAKEAQDKETNSNRSNRNNRSRRSSN